MSQPATVKPTTTNAMAPEPPPKEIVEHGYDHIADWYLSWAESKPSPRERYTQKLLQNIPPAPPPGSSSSPRILELGCGPGVPITRFLLTHGATVTANDISSSQITLARKHCPLATFIPGDMTLLSFESNSFEGAVSFFTIFHLPRSEQAGMLSKIHSWLVPGGWFVFNLATLDQEEIHGEFLGRGMFWSSFGVEDSQKMVKDAGFEIVQVEILEAGDGKLEKDDPDYGVKFMWIAARKGMEGGGG